MTVGGGWPTFSPMVAPGAKTDLSFTVKAVVDGKICAGPFADLLAGNTVVSVYMRNNTGSCDRQNAALIGIAAELKRKGVGLIALSRDTAASHLRYATAKGITYVLVSDPDDQFARAPRQGLLALQLHAGAPMRVFYRNLKLQVLPREEVAVVPQEQMAPPKWIWDATTQDKEEVFFRREFTLGAAAKAGRVTVTCDNHCRVYINEIGRAHV